MAVNGRALADAYVKVHADMSAVSGDVTRGMDQAATKASRATSRKLKEGITTPFREGFAEAARAADPGGAAVGGKLRQGLIGKLRAVEADTTRAGRDAGTGLDRGLSSKMRDVAATTTKAGTAAGKGFTDGAGKATRESGTVLTRIGGGVASGLLSSFAAAAVGMAAINLFGGFIADARESVKIGKLTEQVIATTGGAAKLTASDISDLATSVSNKTGVDDEAIQSGENLLLTFTNIRNEAGKGNDVFTQATGIITDMSVALGQDMKASAIQVGKALQDPIKGVTALQRVGVSFTESQKEQIKTLVASGKTLEAQKIILKELGTEFGGAAAAAATPTDRLRVIVGNLGEQIGTALLPAIDRTAQILSDDVVPAVSAAVGVLQQVPAPVYAIVAGAAGIVLFGKAVGAIKAQALAAREGIIALGASSAATNTVLSGLSKGAGLVALAAVSATITEAASAATSAKVSTEGLDGAMRDLGTTGQVTGAALDVFKQGWGPFSQDVHNSGQAMDEFGKLARGALGGANEGITEWIGRMQSGSDRMGRLKSITEQYDASLAKLASGGSLSTAQAAFGKLMDAAKAQGVSVDELKGLFPQYTAAVTAAGSGAGSAAGVMAALAPALAGQAVTLKDLIGQYPSYKDAIMGAVGAAAVARGEDAQLTAAEAAAGTAAANHAAAVDHLTASLQANNNAVLVLRGGENAYFAALDSVTAAVKENGHTMDVHTTKGRANRAALDQLATAGLGYLDAIQKNNGVGPKFRTTLDQQWHKLYDAAVRFGLSQGAAKRYADQIYKTPKAVATLVSTPGLPKARTGIQGVKKDLDAIDSRNVRLGVTATGNLWEAIASGPYKGKKLPTGYAGGGYTGNGGKYEPKGIVHGGEFVVPKEATSRIGVDNLSRMAGLPGYARGGPVNRHVNVYRGSGWPDDSVQALTGNWRHNTATVASTALDYAKKAWTAGMQAGGGPVPGGAGVTRWAPMMTRALVANGLPLSLLPNELRQIATESGGNPGAIQGNIGDVNNASGDLAKGLLQVIGATFAAYHAPGTSWSVFDPWANMMASLRYQKARYDGHIAGTIGHGHGYAGGTSNAAPGWGWVGENGRELVNFGPGGGRVKTATASRAADDAAGPVRLHPDTIAQLGAVMVAAVARTPIVLDGRAVAGYVDRSMGHAGLSVRG